MIDKKICPRCKIEKSADEFGNLQRSSDGKSPYCSKCLIEKASSSKKNNPVITRANRIRNHIISNSRKKGFDFEPIFTLEKIQEMIEEADYCPCCKKKIDKSYYGDGERHYDLPSFDRFDSNLGYTEENVVVTCWRCNHLKNNATVQELYNIAVYILKYSPAS